MCPEFPLAKMAACMAVLLLSCPAEEPNGGALRGKLASEIPKERQAAEKEILAMGLAALEVLGPWTQDNDPWLRMRAADLKTRVEFGLDPETPVKQRIWLQDIARLPEDSIPAMADALGNQSTWLPLAVLYDRLSNRGGTETKWARDCGEKLERTSGRLRSPPLGSPAFMLGLPAKSRVLEGLAAFNPEEAGRWYFSWRLRDPGLRDHLGPKACLLEFDRLSSILDGVGLLEWIGGARDAGGDAVIIRRARDLAAAGFVFPHEGLSETAAVGYLLVFHGAKEGLAPVPTVEFYGCQKKLHPGIASRLPPLLQTFEIHHLCGVGRFEDGLELAMEQAKNAPARSGSDACLLQLNVLGRWLGNNPLLYPVVLPRISDPPASPARIAFLRGMVSYGYGSFAAPYEQGVWAKSFALLEQVARDDGWTDALVPAGFASLYHMRMAKEGRLAEAVLRHEKECDSSSMVSLGQLLAHRPELASRIPVGHCSPEMVLAMLNGVARVNEDKIDSAGIAARLLVEWSKHHPDLEETANQLPEMRPVMATLAWNRGDRALAFALLGRPQAPGAPGAPDITSRDPTRDIAVLRQWLETVPPGELPALLREANLASPLLGKVVQHWLRDGWKQDHRLLAASMAVLRLLRERAAGGGEPMPAFYLTESREITESLWTRGEDELLDEYLFEFLLRQFPSEDSTEATMLQLVEMIGLRGKAGDFLTRLEAMPTEVRDRNHDFRRAALLRTLGRDEEAANLARAFPATNLARELAAGTSRLDDLEAALKAGRLTRERFELPLAYHAVLANREIPSSVSAATRGHPYVKLIGGESEPYKAVRRSSPRLTPWGLGGPPGNPVKLQSAIEAGAEVRKALEAGSPVPYEALAEYILEIEHLPESEDAMDLIKKAAKADLCQSSRPPGSFIGSGRFNQHAHRFLASGVLWDKGMPDQAFAAASPMLAEKDALAELLDPLKWRALGGAVPYVAGYRSLLLLAGFENPETPVSEPTNVIRTILARPEPVQRADGLFALAEKHRDRLRKEEVHEFLWLALRELNLKGEVDEGMKARARDLLKVPELSDRDTRMLAACWTRPNVRPAAKPPVPPLAQRPRPKLQVDTKGSPDPRDPAFSLPAGLYHAKALQDKGDKAAAVDQLNACLQRMFMGSDTKTREIAISGGDRGFSRGLRAAVPPHDLAIIIFWTEEWDPGVMLPALDACFRAEYYYSRYSTDLYAAHAYAHAGAFASARSALARHLRTAFQANTMPAWSLDAMPLATWYWELELLAAAESGESPGRMNRAFDMCLALDPYNPEPLQLLHVLLKRKGDTAGIASARASMIAAWERKLAGGTTDKNLESARAMWLAIIP